MALFLRPRFLSFIMKDPPNVTEPGVLENTQHTPSPSRRQTEEELSIGQGGGSLFFMVAAPPSQDDIRFFSPAAPAQAGFSEPGLRMAPLVVISILMHAAGYGICGVTI